MVRSPRTRHRAERESYSDVILQGRLESAIDSLNPGLPNEAKDVKKPMEAAT